MSRGSIEPFMAEPRPNRRFYILPARRNLVVWWSRWTSALTEPSHGPTTSSGMQMWGGPMVEPRSLYIVVIAQWLGNNVLRVVKWGLSEGLGALDLMSRITSWCGFPICSCIFPTCWSILYGQVCIATSIICVSWSTKESSHPSSLEKPKFEYRWFKCSYFFS